MSEWPELTEEELEQLTVVQAEARLRGLAREDAAIRRELSAAQTAFHDAKATLDELDIRATKARRRVDVAANVHRLKIEDEEWVKAARSKQESVEEEPRAIQW